MRITRDSLLKIARETANLRAQTDRSVVCIYLTGSLLSNEPLLGGTTDIDLVFIHDGEPEKPREVSRLSQEIHLDIAHLPQAMFQQTRSLRIDPWVGSFLCRNPILLHESQHWFDFTQASVCAQFDQPDYVLRRSRPLVEDARQIWLDLEEGEQEWSPDLVARYFTILEKTANAVACLSGPPLPERRFMLNLPARAEAAGCPGLTGRLVDLILPNPIPEGEWGKVFEAWKTSLADVSRLPDCPTRLQPCRRFYYERGVTALQNQQAMIAAWWVILRTWTLAACHLPADSLRHSEYLSICQTLGLDADAFEERLEALDACLDEVEETLDIWSREYGIN